MTRGVRPRPANERFWVKVQKSDDCWTWTGATQAGGYGRFMVSSNPRTLVLAHRFAYETLVGPIEGDLTIDHLCMNPSCVNPVHLETVTREENALRANRHVGKTHCDRGHEFSAANTYRAPSRPQVRCCRTCRAEYGMSRRASVVVGNAMRAERAARLPIGGEADAHRRTP